MYYIILVFQVQLAQTALGIGHRFQRINIILRTILLNGESSEQENTAYWYFYFRPSLHAEKTNMYVTRLPSLRNINRVVDELGNGKKSERDPSQAPTISILTQSKLVLCHLFSLCPSFLLHTISFFLVHLRPRNESGTPETKPNAGQYH